MKRRSVIAFVFFVMVLAILGIGFIISTNIEVVKFALTTADTQYSKSAIQFLVSVLLVFLCWISLLVIFIRLLKSDNFIEFGKKDGLTGIGNRNYLEGVFKKQSFSYDCQIYLVYFAFSAKKITSKYDSSLLNKIQKEIAAVLKGSCAGGEYAARLGDGEFAMILTAQNGVLAEQRVLDTVNKLNQCQNQIIFEIFTPVQSGFCCLNDYSSADFLTVLQNAKTAYLHSVNHSLYTYIFSDKLVILNQSNKLKEKKITNAIDNKEFEVYMQLIYDTKRDRFVGCEALSRWNSDDGLIMPMSYIADMHTCGIIEKFDMYMFDNVCAVLHDWNEKTDFKDLFVSCNITRTTVSSDSFIKNVKEISDKYTFRHEKMIIEITEDALIDDMDIAYKNIIACRDMGFKIALDDFGAGNSSFSDINNYPFDQLKIDRQFTKSLTTNKGYALMNAFVEMAHGLNISIVCEGVETKEQANAAKKLDIDFIQGHFYSYVYPLSEVCKKYTESLNKS